MNGNAPPMARPRAAAGAVFLDEQGRVLLVQPAYKDLWDIPGGYVEPGESPMAACRREVAEELGIDPPIGTLLVVDWAPHPEEGDKLLFVFDGGVLDQGWMPRIRLQKAELETYRFCAETEFAAHLPERLIRRLTQALIARRHGSALYVEHGQRPVESADSAS